jgi:hypothetical protein
MITCEWSATYDHMPGAQQRLTVRGACTCASAGYTLGLARAEPQGVNRKDLILTFEVMAPGEDNTVDQVETACTVEFVEENAPEYETVTIQGEAGESITVSHVH